MYLPLYTHPTLTVLIDDSQSFLNSVAFQLDPIHPCKAFHDTAVALEWIRKNSPPHHMPLHVNFDNQDPFSIALDLNSIYHIASQAQRFMTPAVLVVDYSMPQMNGLEFCERVRDLPCKKILLTGEANEKIAVGAFNSGLIDRYIQKSDSRALDILEIEIAELKNQYFEVRSAPLRELVSLHNFHFMDDPILAQQVQRIKEEHGYSEYYLFPNPAGILFMSKFGQTQLMVIETEQSMAIQIEMARDNDAPQSLLDALQERRLLAFFSDADGDGMYSRSMVDTWHRYCAAAQMIQGRELYYWALFDLPAHFFIQPPSPYVDFVRHERGLVVD